MVVYQRGNPFHMFLWFRSYSETAALDHLCSLYNPDFPLVIPEKLRKDSV